MPSFQRRTIYVGPHDLKNLNRSFPGKRGGTVTERIAAALTDAVITKADYLIDIHAGDGNEGLRPSYSAYYAEAGGPAVIRESERLARAFGLDYIVLFRGQVSSPQQAIYTSAQAVANGIPAIDIESGELGRRSDEYVRPIVSGVYNVLAALKMLPGAAATVSEPLYIRDRARVYSDHDGIWYPSDLVRPGDFVTTGQELGYITDYHGKRLMTVAAPANGILLIRFGSPPVNRGDNLIVIGAVDGRSSAESN
ncbi:MAG: succinylglutamate desuccinylase/aspartoacylase family protein [Pseudomonadota bacterium]